jgi:cell division protein FtsB
MLQRTYRWFHDLLHHPARVFWICVILAGAGVILDGTAFRIWSLRRDHDLLARRIDAARTRTRQLEFRIQKAHQPEFIEKAVRDQFDLVKEGDLIFIFSDEGSEVSEKTKEESNSGNRWSDLGSSRP